MPKESLKDRIDGNELDLSVSSLDVVPVTELIALPKATHLDLSCNLLRNLPNDFGTLQHLVHLDLSKNQLVELPKTFGDLKKLQHLDLLGNQLETLPVSLYRLRNLRWLDVKDNPLKEPLKGVVGDCLDERQCKACAVNVLNFMRKVQAEQERQLQKRLQEERELEEKRKLEENREKQRIKEERKREKERRRREHQERLAEQKKEEVTPDDSCPDKYSDSDEATEIVQQKVKRSGLSCCGVLLAILMGLTAVVVGLFIYCSSHSRDQTCRQVQIMVSEYQRDLQMIWRDTYDVVQDYFKKSSDPVNK